jgi:hypothetical protein
MPTMRAQPSGSSKAVNSRNGKNPSHCCGYTENVCLLLSVLCATQKNVLFYSRIREECSQVRHSLIRLVQDYLSSSSSSIIQDIKGATKAGLAHIAYFFFDFKDERKQDSRALLSSLIVQLSHLSDPLLDILFHYYSIHQSGSNQPGDLALTQCLEDMLRVPVVPIYLILDALDECPSATGLPPPREKVLEVVKGLIKLNLPNLHLCVTSRQSSRDRHSDISRTFDI